MKTLKLKSRDMIFFAVMVLCSMDLFGEYELGNRRFYIDDNYELDFSDDGTFELWSPDCRPELILQGTFSVEDDTVCVVPEIADGCSYYFFPGSRADKIFREPFELKIREKTYSVNNADYRCTILELNIGNRIVKFIDRYPESLWPFGYLFLEDFISIIGDEKSYLTYNEFYSSYRIIGSSREFSVSHNPKSDSNSIFYIGSVFTDGQKYSLFYLTWEVDDYTGMYLPCYVWAEVR